MMNKFKLSFFIATTVFLLGGCSDNKSVEQTQTESGYYPTEIQGYTKKEGSLEWKKNTEVYKSEPQRVVATTRPAAELLLHLGLKDHIAGVGATFGAPDPEVSEDFDELTLLGDNYIGKELALSVNPDLIYGRGGLFENQDWGVGSIQSLQTMGIQTYVLGASVTGATFESVYEDIERTGQLFNKIEEAKIFDEKIRVRQQEIEERVANQNVKTFAYIHTGDPSQISVYTASDEPFFNDIFKMIKLENVYENQSGEVSLETLVETDPDVLIVGDWSSIEGSTSVDKVVDALYDNSKLSSMTAIKNKEVYTVDYNYLFGYGYQSLFGLEQLLDQMQP